MGKSANPEAFTMMQKKRRIYDGLISRAAVETEAKKARLRLEDAEKLAKAKVAQPTRTAAEVGCLAFALTSPCIPSH